MNKKFLPLLLVLVAISLFFAFQSKGNDGNDNPKTKNEKILRNVGLLLEQGHYSPKKIDDNFSKEILKIFIEDLDADKSIFLQSDIDDFYKKYSNVLDDEIHGTKDLKSFYAIEEVYSKRLNEASTFYTAFLKSPFDFKVNESVDMDTEKSAYPKTENDRKDVWRKKLKYLVLSRYADMLDDRDKNDKKNTVSKSDSTTKNDDDSDDDLSEAKDLKVKADFVYKADTTLERESRDKVRKQIDRYFTTLKTHNTTDEVFSSFVNAITTAMDPHSSYFPPVDARSFNETMSGTFFGIGAQLKEDDSKIKISSLITGGPAWKSGELQVEDEIIKIGEGANEPVDVTGYSVSDAVKLIRGAKKGTEVRLTVKRIDGTTKVVSLMRDQIKLDDTFARSAVIGGEHKIGYIYLPEFYIDFERPDGAKCSEDVAKEIEKLKAEGVEGIMIDLRGNGGGSLPEVVKMVGLFIEDGPVVQVKGREEKPYQWKDRDKSVLYSGPLTVLVDENSASASEIFAAAIQDYKRGVILGSTSTYGKGTVQRNIPLNPEGGAEDIFSKKAEDLGTVKLTLQKFYRVNGGATQLKGVTPDVVIPDRYEHLKFREKDNNTSLSWDEISKTDYKPWVSTYSSDVVIKQAKDQIKNNTAFTSMKAKVDSIDKLTDKQYSLNIDQYRADLKQLNAMYKDLNALYKLNKNLDVKNNVADTAAYNADKEKAEKNKKFLDRVKKDVYIDETVKVMNEMIGEGNTAATKMN